MKYTFLVLLMITAAAAGEDMVSAQDVVPETAWETAYGTHDANLVQAKPPAPRSNQRILENIQDLLAYAKAVNDKAVDMTAEHQGKDRTCAPVLRLLIELVSAQKKHANPVVAFNTAHDKTSRAFREGLGAYVLKLLHRSVRRGKGVVMHTTTESEIGEDFMTKKPATRAFALLNAKKLGFRTQPHYFVRLMVKVKEFTKNKQSINIKGAFAAAKKACLTKGSMVHLKGFTGALVRKRKARVWRAAVKLARGAYKNIKRTKAMLRKPSSGIQGGKAALKKNGRVLVLSNKQLKARAKRMANSWARNKGQCGSMYLLIMSRAERASRHKESATEEPAKVVTHNKKKAKKLAKKYSKPAKKAKKLFALAQAAAKAKKAAAAKAAAQKNIRENARKVARSKKIAALKRKAAAAAKAKHAKEQKAKADKALAKARAIRDKKERAYKNRVVRKCTTTDKWANCTAHPISWYTNCKGAGTSRPTWRRCGFLNAGGQYLCRRVTCRNVRVRI